MVLDRIRRVTRDGRYIPEIDGLRFIAIALVLLFHLAGEIDLRTGRTIPVEPRYSWLHTALGHGDRGVGLFFVISGMILALPFARHYLLQARPVSLRKYYMRRITRLEPPYLLSLLIYTLMVLAFTHTLPAGYGGEVAANTVYLHDLIYGRMGVSTVIWSLEVEVQFYLLAPLLMLAFLIPGKLLRRSTLLAALLFIGLSQMEFSWMHTTRGEMSVVFYLQYFLAGLIIADIFTLDLPAINSSWLWDAGGLVAFVVLIGLSGKWSSHIAMPFLCIVLCVAAMRSVLLRRFVANGWIAAIGGMCYSIYLLHFAVMAAVFKLSRRLLLPQFDYLATYSIQLFLVTMPILIWSVGYFILVERPCMDPDWPGKLWQRLTGRSMRDADSLDTAGVTE